MSDDVSTKLDDDDGDDDAAQVPQTPEEAESVAEAPGPITPEHESGSWEQTLAEREAQEQAREASKRRSD